MKSFSGLTKEELFKEDSNNPCCDVAEFAGLLLLGCSITHKEIKLVTENRDVLGRFAALCRRHGFETKTRQSDSKSNRYIAVIDDATRILTILNDFDLIDPSTGIIRYRISPESVKNECCRRAFIKGAFLAGGTIIDPGKNYNLEFVTPYMGLSRDFAELLREAGFAFKTVVRKSKYVLYIKNSETIQDFLTYIGAYRAQMALINIKIEKEIRNDFNRVANGETANIEKTINASVRQIQAIEAIDEKMGLENLPDELEELARLRLEHKSMSLQELGEQLLPPLGKSGVNHRFQKIEAIADKLCEKPKE